MVKLVYRNATKECRIDMARVSDRGRSISASNDCAVSGNELPLRRSIARARGDAESLGGAALDVLEDDVRVPLGHLQQAKRGAVGDSLLLFPGANGLGADVERLREDRL